MFIDFILEKIKANLNQQAMVIGNQSFLYSDLIDAYNDWLHFFEEKNIAAGSIIAVRADYHIAPIALMLVIIEKACVFVPFSHLNKDVDEKMEIVQVEYFFDFHLAEYRFYKNEPNPVHPMIKELRDRRHPGIIIFSSGSTGKPKAALHDFSFLLDKFKVQRKPLRTITFLLFDHWGGMNTLFYILSNAGMIGMPNKREPEAVCEFIQKNKIELLPTTPTFINLILMSKAYEQFDISSLKTVSYGTEAMPEATLKAFHKCFPKIEMKQTYGLTELGVMRTRSKSFDSLWMQVGGEDYETKIVDGILFIKAKTAILGYLNSASPFDSEGWYNTGDRVLQDGEWIKILGRDSDIINVGGQKVFPAEVESVLLEMPQIRDVSVFAIDNPVLGKAVAADVVLFEKMDQKDFKRLLRQHCLGKIEDYKIPIKIRQVERLIVGERFKKIRDAEKSQ